MEKIASIDYLFSEIEASYLASQDRMMALCQEFTMLANSSLESELSCGHDLGKIQFMRGLAKARVEEAYNDAIALLQEALSHFQRHEQLSNQTKVLLEIARCHSFLDEVGAAAEYNHEVITLATKVDDYDALIMAHYHLGITYFSIGDYEHAYKLHSDVLATSQKYDNRNYECLALSSLGNIMSKLGRYEEGIECALSAIGLSKANGYQKAIVYTHRYLVTLYRLSGKYKEALVHGELAEVSAVDTDVQLSETIERLIEIGYVYIELEEFDEALSRLNLALDLSNKIESQYYKMGLHDAIAKAHEGNGDITLALQHLKTYLTYSEAYYRHVGKTRLRVLEVHKAIEQSEQEREIHRLHNIELTLKNQQLESALNEKEQIISFVSHDLRNPLTAIQMTVDLHLRLKSDALDAQARDQLNRIRQLVRRMSSSVSGLIEMQQAKYSLGTIDLEPVLLLPLITELSAQYEVQLEQKQIELKIDCVGQTTAASANEKVLYRILDNILSNAIKFSFPNTTITLSVQPSENQVQIAVCDQGQGLSLDDRQMLFIQFAKLSAQPTAGESTTGLGLFITKQLVEAMNGTINAESPGKDQGSTFTVTLAVSQ